MGNEVTEMHFGKEICVELNFVVIYVSDFILYHGHKILQIKLCSAIFMVCFKE